jgi:hypothetical protein
MCTADTATACPGAQCALPEIPYATDDGRGARTLSKTRVECENGKCRTSAQCDDTLPCAADSACVHVCDWAWCKRIPAGCAIGSQECADQLCGGPFGDWMNDREAFCITPCIK